MKKTMTLLVLLVGSLSAMHPGIVRAERRYEVKDLGEYGGAYANRVNSTGQVTGDMRTASGLTHAFLYSNGVLKDLGALGPPSGGASIGRDLNDSGQIIGYYYDGPAGDEYRAFMYSCGTAVDIGTLGGEQSIPFHITEDGHIVGVADDALGNHHAFLYSDGIMTDLGTLGGLKSAAAGMNALGQIVGEAQDASGEWHAFLYSDGVMYDLNDYTTGYSGIIEYANQINDLGMIAAGKPEHTTSYGALSLTPVREPSFFAFYNNSCWDDSNGAANAADDDAIAMDKVALRPGNKATFANYTSYDKGINGLMIDVYDLPGTPTLNDFLFRVGNNDKPYGEDLDNPDDDWP